VSRSNQAVREKIMSVKYNLNQPSSLRRGCGIIFLFLLLLWNREAGAQNYLLRYVNTASGAVTFTGNTLGLAKLSGQNQPGALDSIGAFITLNTNSQVGTYPNGTTLDWSNDSSAAVLQIPTNSTVLYAELIWSGSAQIATDTSATGDVLGYLNTPVQFILPDGTTNSIVPDPVTASLVTNGTSAIFYVRSANVTALVQAAGTGTYSAGGVPGTVLASEDANNACGWTLAVVYENSSLHQRNLSLFVGDSFAISGGTPPNPAAVTGFCAPLTGAVNARLFVSAVEGDPNKAGDQMLFGPTTNSLAVLSGPNNLADNFFAGQINGDNGLLDTSGTFGFSNSVPPNVAFSARQGWDITSVDVSSGLTNGITSAYAQNVTSSDGYMVNALALQIDVGSPVLTTTQSVDKASTFVGDILTYTVTVTNSGTADAVDLIFTDPLPFGTSFVTNTFATNGVVVAAANPVDGVPVPIIKQNSSLTFTYQALVGQIPPSAKFITAATIDFQYAGVCAQSPIINGTLVNANVQTLVPLLNVNKAASLTNVIPGANLTYTINIPNVGTTNTVGSTLIDPIPAGVTYVTNTTTLNGVSVPDIGGTNMPYTVATEINGPGRPAGQINAGDTAVITFQVKISSTPPVHINNTATIYANGIAPTTAQNAAANISPVYSDLAVGISGSPNPVAAGAAVSYTISVTNNGPNSVNDITNFITLYLPLSASILSPVYTPNSGTYNPLNGVWSGITLASNGVVTLTVSGQVSPDAVAGNIVSSVTVTPPPGVIDTVTNNNSAAATNAVVQAADLAVTISDGVTNVHQGDALTYTITAVNLGPSTLTSITLSNSLSALLDNFTYAPDHGNYNPVNGVWSGLVLAAGDSATLTLQADVPDNVTGAATNSTTGFVPPGVTDPDLTNNSASDIDTILATPDVAIFKAGPANVYAGTNFNYTITVTNSGFATASNVVVSDVLPTNVLFVSASGNGTTNSGAASWNLGNLAASGTSNLTLTVTAPPSGNITNIATVAASTVDSNPGNNTSLQVATTVTPVADLTIGKTAPASVVATSNFVYTISITNLGPSTASGVVVTDTLPAAVTFVSASGGGVNNGGTVSWALGSFISGQASNLILTVKAPASGSITNTAKINSATLDTNAVNNTSPQVISTVTTLALSADIRVSKTGPANVFAGTNFSYTITVTNSGPGTASNVVASDVLPTNVVFVSASGNGATNAGIASWTIGTLAASATTNLTLIVTAPASGTITNVATAASTTADPVLGNNTSSPVGTTVTPLADVAVTESGPANVFAGTNFSYTVTVTNSGPSTASNVVVSDSLPTGIVFVSATGGGISNSGAVTWPTITTLTNGGTFTFNVTVTAPAGGTLTNIVSGISPTSDPIPTNNNGSSPSAIVITTVSPVADLAVGKSGPAGSFLGANFSYTISVTNFGPSTAAAFSVTDNLPAGLVFAGAVPNATTNASHQVAWTNLNNLAAGAVTNLTLSVTATLRTTITNFAFAGSPVFDPDTTNNVSAPAITAVTNRPPVAVNDTAGTPKNIPVTIPVLKNDSDPDGDALTIVSVSPTNGTANIVGTNVVFMPATNFIGTATVGYKISDGFGGTNSALITISVTNRPPVAVNDTAGTPENVAVTIPVLENDSDPDGDALTIVSVSPTNGTANIAGTNVVFTPATNFIGTATFGYTITDGFGGTNSALINVVVTNRPPLANPDNYGVGENSTNTLNPLVNDVVVTPGGSLTLIGVSPTNGSANISGTNVIFVPATNFLGVATIGYTITDNVGGTNSGLITVTVTNRPPVAVNDTATTGVNLAVTVPVLKNDSDPDGNPLTIVSVSPTNGTANISGTNVVFTPATNFVGTGYVLYSITDGNGATNSALVTITVTNIIVVPTADGQSVTASENTALPVTLTGSDPDNQALTFVIVSAPTNGTLTLFDTNTGTVTYTPKTNYSGADAFTFRVNNGQTNSAAATVLVTVLPVADLLVVESGPASGVAGSNMVFTVAVTNLGPATATNIVITNQIDAGFTFVGASSSGTDSNDFVIWTIPSLPANGRTNLTVTAFAAEGGAFTNIASGASSTLDLNPTNNSGALTNAQTRTVVSALADVAVFKTASTNVNAGAAVTYTIIATNSGPSTATNVVVQDNLPANVVFQSASGGYALSNNIVTWPSMTLSNGGSTNFIVTLIAPASGSFTNIALAVSGTPDPNPTNNNGSAASSKVRTTVTPVADVATGKSGPAGIFVGTNFSYTISVTNFGPSTATALSVTDNLPAGLVFVSASPAATTNASHQVIWTNLGSLATGATTNLILNVKATLREAVTNLASAGSPVLDTDNTNNTSAPVVTFVTNRPPVAVNDSASTPKNVTVTIPVLANDSDPDGDALTIVSVSPTNGTANIVGTNVVFTPATNFTGTATIGYTISDGFGGTNSALVTISVTNRPPVANSQSVTTPQNTAKAILLTGNDADGDTLTFLIVSNPTNGVLSLLNTNTGAVTYTPDTNFAGADSFTFRVNDGTTNSGIATVSISVSAPSPADIAVFKTGPATGVAGSNLVYTITVTNSGPSAATNVLVSDQLPGGFTFVSATPATATVASNLVSWPAFNLANKGKTNFTVKVVSTEGGSFTNVAFATSDSFDPNPTNNNGTSASSQARTVVTPLADVAVFKTGGTNVMAGSAVTYTITATNSGPSTATGVVVQDKLPANVTFQSASGDFVLSNNIVTWTSMTLSNGGSTNFTVILIAPASGSFTNIALGTSSTPDLNTNNNNGSAIGSKVKTSVTPLADVIVLLLGPTNVSVGDDFSYTIIVTNGGPSTATNVVLKDNLPGVLTFKSASAGGALSNNIITWPKIVSLTMGGSTNFTVTVNAATTGQFTNIAFATAGTADPDLTNNDGALPISQVQTMIVSPQFDILSGSPAFNPQTGLYEELVVVTNISATPVAGVRLYVGGLRSGVTLYNAAGTTNGLPYVEYDATVNSSNTVTFALEFYDPSRLSFTNTLTAVAILPPDSGSTGTNGVAISSEFMDTRIAGDTRFVIEFITIPGKTYTIIYSDDLMTWLTAVPSITANANVTQWYDDGPPKTVSKPESVGSRFYRIIQN
jgi:uncharacterized repeat protein (TIGR01451 family)